MKNKVVIAGGTGFIGNYLKKKYKELGYNVVIISRNKGDNQVRWEDTTELIKAVNQSKLLINLSGKSVDCRYNSKNKWNILSSRTSTTLRLHDIVEQCDQPPETWINSSTATIYRHAEDRPMTEEKGELGEGFSVQVARTWESVFFAKKYDHVKQVAIRTAIVLGDGSAFKPLKGLAKIGFGGPQGKGDQKFSWIHIEDLFGIIRHIEQQKNPKNIYNCTSPNPTSNKELMQLVRKHHGRKWYIPIPKLLLEIGAFFIRTETELVLKSRWVLPEHLETEGFQFKFNTLESAIESLP